MAITIEKAAFGTTGQGDAVTGYLLKNNVLAVRLLDYGATIQSLLVREQSGTWVDVVLGYDTVKEYEENDGYLGACIGRVGNRIGGAQFVLNDRTYPLYKNDGENHLHGGLRGFDKYIWQTEALPDGIRFSRISADGEEGYPGTLAVSVSYRLDHARLSIEYEAQADADTLCSLTNHAYFNLNGCGSVLSHTLQVNADGFLENDSGCLPTGQILPVEGSPFDFRIAKEIGRDIGMNDRQLQNCGGYDHNFCLISAAPLHEAAALSGDRSGIIMRVHTTLPGIQVYSANFLTARKGKCGQIYEKHGALCLETQFYPNAMSCAGFEKPILRAGEHYHHVTTFTFQAGEHR